MSIRRRYSQVVVEFIPRAVMEPCYKRTAPIVRSFDGTEFTLLDLAAWCYSQGVMDGIQVAARFPHLTGQTSEQELNVNFEI